MNRRDLLLALLVGAIASAAPPLTALSRDDDDDGGGRGRGRGRGGDDGGFDDRGGGGSSSGHGSAEERAAVLGDDRGDRADARLRETVRENAIQDRELMRRGRDGQVNSNQPEHAEAPSTGSRGFFADLADLFRGR